MVDTYELKTKVFAGPIEKLLELIESKKLDITAVSLSEVTADFLSYLGNLKEVPPAVLADFIVVASRLMLIKSKALLPEFPLSEEEEADIKDLEDRLVLYKECKAAGKLLGELWKGRGIAYDRELLGSYSGSVFYPPAELDREALRRSIESLLTAIEAVRLREKNIARVAIISIEEKMEELLRHLGDKRLSGFKELAKTKEEAIALFLAVLHLLKDRLIAIEQESNFSDIVIHSRQNEEGGENPASQDS